MKYGFFRRNRGWFVTQGVYRVANPCWPLGLLAFWLPGYWPERPRKLQDEQNPARSCAKSRLTWSRAGREIRPRRWLSPAFSRAGIERHLYLWYSWVDRFQCRALACSAITPDSSCTIDLSLGWFPLWQIWFERLLDRGRWGGFVAVARWCGFSALGKIAGTRILGHQVTPLCPDPWSDIRGDSRWHPWNENISAGKITRDQ